MSTTGLTIRTVGEKHPVTLAKRLASLRESNRELLEALEGAYVIIEGLRIGTKWEISPTIKEVMAGWVKEAEAAIRKTKGEPNV